jgi:hypothetical protein
VVDDVALREMFQDVVFDVDNLLGMEDIAWLGSLDLAF